MAKRESIVISEDVVIENGPAKKSAIATKELLDDSVTREHYAEGVPDTMSKTIVIGESMTYLDYYAPFVWYVYQKRDVAVDVFGKVIGIGPNGEYIDIPDCEAVTEKFVIAGVFPSKNEAITFAEGVK